MPERAGRSRVFAAGIVVLAAVGLLLAPTAACTTHDCDASTSTFALGAEPDAGTQGIRFDLGNGVVQLASSPWDGTWMDYPGGRTITVTYPSWFVPDPAAMPTVAVSTGLTQDAGATSTSAAGSLNQYTFLTSTGFQLNNGTCADYSVWLSVTGTVTPAVAEAGVEAGVEASVDASHE